MEIRFIQNLIAAPIFEDEERTRVALLLHRLILGVVSLSLIYGVIGLIARTPISTVYALGISIAAAFMHAIARWGYVRAAAIGFTLGLWLILSIPWITDPSQTIYDTNFTAYLIPVLLSGFLLGGRASLLMATLSAFVGLLVLSDATRPVLISAPDSTLRWAA